MATTLTINGTSHMTDLPDAVALLWVLRDALGLTGTKIGCGFAAYPRTALEIRTDNQAPVLLRNRCADAVDLRSDQVTVHTTLLGGGFWRSVGASISGFMLEIFIDKAAHPADPCHPRHAPCAGVISAVRDMSGWTGQTPANIGRGVAFPYSLGTPLAQVVEVLDENETIRISKVWIACDVGTALTPDTNNAEIIGGAI